MTGVLIRRRKLEHRHTQREDKYDDTLQKMTM